MEIETDDPYAWLKGILARLSSLEAEVSSLKAQLRTSRATYGPSPDEFIKNVERALARPREIVVAPTPAVLPRPATTA